MIYDERNSSKIMISSSSRGKDAAETKQEGETNDGKLSNKGPSSSRQWSGFRNPRIVRVSRSFGGKDRHSKVCTIRGLRDRRIRLSVPTAIQLYDLQDRLGLTQPSKVIDWLLDATKDDIDKLPPLQIPQGFGHHFHQHMLLNSHEPNTSTPNSLPNFFDATNSMFMKDHGEEDHHHQSKRFWDMEAHVALRAKSKELVDQRESNKGKWVDQQQQQGNEDQDGNIGDYSDQQQQAAAEASAQKLFPILPNNNNHSSLLNNSMPFNPYYHWEPNPSLSLSQFGNHGFLSTHSQTENFLNGNNNSTNNTASSVPILPSSAAHQLFFCPPPSTMPSLFPTYPPYVATPTGEDNTDSRQHINHFQLLTTSNNSHHHILPNSAGTMMRPNFSLNVNAGLSIHTQDDDDQSHADDDQDHTDS